MSVLPSKLRLRAHFIVISGIGVTVLVLCASLAFIWVATQQTEERFQTISKNELNSLHALVLSVMTERRQDPDNVAIRVFNSWFEKQNADYPGKLWSVWGPKAVAYMATKDPSKLAKLSRDAIDVEVMRTGKPVGRFVGDAYRYSMPIVLGVTSGADQKICVPCHANKMNMAKGDVIAIFSSSLTTTAAIHRLRFRIAIITGGTLLAGIGMLLVLRMLFGRVVTKPVSEIIGTMESLTKGDLDVSVPFVNRFNEVGDIAKAVQVFKQNLVQNRELFSQVESANRKLESTATELKRALAIADTANKAKSLFLASVSHELRTPLNAIIGFSEIHKDEMFGPSGNETYRGYAEDIFNSGTHLLTLINDILEFSKCETNQLTLNDDVVDLNEIVSSCTRFVETQAKRAKVKISAALEIRLPQLRADARRVRQILINLLSNAVKFTPEGGRVTISTAQRDNGLAVVIADTGIGIAVEDIPIALRPFGQIDNSLSRKYEGTGLGLPLAKELVELHGGTLTIESAVRVGTTVTVWFPAERVLTRGATNLLYQKTGDFSI